ncbi:MAG: photosynthesis system II assembly factor Ycf48 [Leptolyngbyaceae cyanobacterium bins.59]|nr:photosynthesis system II assembly factor Ycf48 [Leptolyngbyaceae cyanobacterium bins.59]
MNGLLRGLRRIVVLLGIAFLCASCTNAYLPSVADNPWKVLSLPTDAFLSDVSFSTPSHGWLVGGSSTIMETQDGGNTWEPKPLDLGEQKYRFSSVSFKGDEGWIVGQPSILLHTKDGGNSWSQIPLSSKLPGSTNTILALGPNSAEMTTDVGAIYRTIDGGQNWKAMVQQAVGVLRNIERSSDGKYIAVSAKGNFYSVWEPGQDAWEPHNRNSSRRVQNMGFTPDGRLWMLARGGLVQFTTEQGVEDWQEAKSPEFATSWGLLHLAYRTPEELWLAGGSGNLLRSTDGGQTWQKDRAVENVPSNLYKIVFLTPEQGFILGQNGTLLKYESPAQSA